MDLCACTCACAFGGLWNIGKVQREGVNLATELRAWLHEPGWLALQRSPYLSYTEQKSPLWLYVNRASPVSWDPSCVCWAARRINQARNRTTGNTLIMLVLYIKMAAPGWPFSCNTGIKVTSAELASPAHVIRPLLQGVLLRSLHVTR